MKKGLLLIVVMVAAIAVKAQDIYVADLSTFGVTAQAILRLLK